MNKEPVDFENKTEVDQKQKSTKMFFIHKQDNEEADRFNSEDELEEMGRHTENALRENSQFRIQERILDSDLHFLSQKRAHFNAEEESLSGSKHSKHSLNSKGNSMDFNTGRWTDAEHKKFLEAILIYGNEWKNVQKYISTRSSTQARSHAQKFFLRLKKNFKFCEELNKATLCTLDEKEKKSKKFN